MWFLFAQVAQAQEITNGTFEGNLDGWALQASTGRMDRVDTPDQGWVLRITRNGADRAAVCSAPFALTLDRVSALMRNGAGSSDLMSWWVGDPVTHAVLINADEIPDDAVFGARTLDVSARCGDTVELCFEPHANGLSPQLFLDDVALDGDACPIFVDGDGDGWCPEGQDLDGDQLCVDPGEFDSATSDCDDADPEHSPATPEICDGLDQDCDGEVDEGLPTDVWYPDVDGDGYGDASGATVEACDQPAGYASADPADCDDHNSAIHPGAPDAADDGVDQDCDGADAQLPDRSGSGDDDKGVGCACDSSGGSAWLLVPLLLLARRRR